MVLSPERNKHGRQYAGAHRAGRSVHTTTGTDRITHARSHIAATRAAEAGLVKRVAGSGQIEAGSGTLDRAAGKMLNAEVEVQPNTIPDRNERPQTRRHRLARKVIGPMLVFAAVAPTSAFITSHFMPNHDSGTAAYAPANPGRHGHEDITQKPNAIAAKASNLAAKAIAAYKSAFLQGEPATITDHGKTINFFVPIRSGESVDVTLKSSATQVWRTSPTTEILPGDMPLPKADNVTSIIIGLERDKNSVTTSFIKTGPDKWSVSDTSNDGSGNDVILHTTFWSGAQAVTQRFIEAGQQTMAMPGVAGLQESGLHTDRVYKQSRSNLELAQRALSLQAQTPFAPIAPGTGA